VFLHIDFLMVFIVVVRICWLHP